MTMKKGKFVVYAVFCSQSPELHLIRENYFAITPNGKVDFVELIGVTNEELLSIINKEQTVRGIYSELGSDITDYSRS